MSKPSEIAQQITREPAALLGLVTASTGLLILFGVPLTLEQAGGILALVGALVTALRAFVVPAREVLAQARPDGVVAGPASSLPPGTPADIVVRRVH